MLKKMTVYVTSVMLFCLIFYQWVFAAENLLQNPSFEDTNNNMPVGWYTWVWDYKPDIVDFRVEQEGSRSGQYYVTIENKEARDSRFLQEVAVKPNTSYKFSGWIKTENVGKDVLGANLSLEGNVTRSKDVRGTVDEWQYTELYIRIGEGVDTIKLSLGLGGYGNLNVGKASFDDVAFEEVDSIPEGVNYALIENPDAVSESKDDESKSEPGNTEGKYTTVWLVVSCVVLATIFFYYYSSGKLKLKDNKDDE
ncbi:MAG TPA: carbohydrate binding domain-containing protein [Acetivibrio sp.]|nr:carbohydrate-binding protein [Clostridium sp.]HOQ37549.1 carbohydrate binding domain-containing protein [Acetivibrio sp.]HPT91649.1 carbohydrate binding domain-containing protein [Acetivibrio sp.]HQA57451.1 carbohydrate binding domain-containing protein [Acetivibrio sp.]